MEERILIGFRGRYQECLRHYFGNLLAIHGKGTHKIGVARQPMIDFCDVSYNAVLRWEGQKSAPIGGMAFRIMVFLSELGYEIIEFERMTPAKKGVIEVLAFGVVSIGEILETLGFNNEGELYRFFRRDQVVRGDMGRKIAVAWELYVKNKGELDNRKQDFMHKFGLSNLENNATPLLVTTNTPDVEVETLPKYPSHERPLLFSLCKILELQFRQLCVDQAEQKLLTKEEHDAILQLGITARELAKKLFGEVSDAP